MTQKEKIKDILTDQNEATLFYLYNDYIHKQHYYDNEIFLNDEIDELLQYKSPSDILLLAWNGDFSPNDHYFTFDGYGNLQSFDSILEVFNFDEIAEYIINSGDDFDIDEIADILTPETEQ